MKQSITAKILGLVLLAGAGFAAPSACAQQEPQKPLPIDVDEVRASIEVLRSDVNTSKIRVFNEVMKLTGPEAEKFWPVYRNYEQELALVGDRKLELIRKFATSHFTGTLDNKSADELARGALKNNQERLDLWKKYHKKISKAVSPIRAAQFLQIEHQMALFVDVSIAAEMPAVGSKPPSQQ